MFRQIQCVACYYRDYITGVIKIQLLWGLRIGRYDVSNTIHTYMHTCIHIYVALVYIICTHTFMQSSLSSCKFQSIHASCSISCITYGLYYLNTHAYVQDVQDSIWVLFNAITYVLILYITPNFYTLYYQAYASVLSPVYDPSRIRLCKIFRRKNIYYSILSYIQVNIRSQGLFIFAGQACINVWLLFTLTILLRTCFVYTHIDCNIATYRCV